MNGSISRDGRFVAFQSGATNLVANDANGLNDVFVRDRTLGTTTLVSVSTGGAQGMGASLSPSISGDGRRVAFLSSAPNLVAGDTNGIDDVFVRDLIAGTTVRVNVDSFGVQANGQTLRPKLSYDGVRVVFASDATNLVVGDTNGRRDVFLHDLSTGVTERVSLGPGGVQANNYCETPSISGDGRYVAYASSATNLVAPPDLNGVLDVYVYEVLTQNTALVTLGVGGAPSNGSSFEPVLDFDGSHVAYFSVASNLVASDVNAKSDVFVSTAGGGATILVSVAPSGVQGDQPSSSCAISDDGQIVVFDSYATNFTPGDTNGNRDVFVRDLGASTTICASLTLSGVPGSGIATGPAISGDGRDVLFHSSAGGFVAGDTHNSTDVFVVDIDGASQPSAYCTAGVTSSGCQPQITSSGAPIVGATSGFDLRVDAVEGAKIGLFFYGVNGRAATPWGTGSSFLCVKSPSQRTPTQGSGGFAGTCGGVYVLDWSAFVFANPTSLGAPFAAGDTVDAQAWFRDPPAPKSTNLSNALEFVVSP